MHRIGGGKMIRKYSVEELLKSKLFWCSQCNSFTLTGVEQSSRRRNYYTEGDGLIGRPLAHIQLINFVRGILISAQYALSIVLSFAKLRDNRLARASAIINHSQHLRRAQLDCSTRTASHIIQEFNADRVPGTFPACSHETPSSE